MRRQRVTVRPQVRSRRARQRAAALTVLALGVLAALVVKRLGSELDWTLLKGRLLPAPSAVAGAPDALAPRLESFLKTEAAGLSARQAADALLERFPCLSSARPRRDWLSRAARVEVSLRRPIAALESSGKSAGYLSEDGVVFAAPADVFSLAAPVVEPGAASPDELKRLAVFLPLALRPGELMSPLARMRFVSPQDGWEARLEDGTPLLWGALKWTPEKLERLREVVLDARARDGEQKVKAMTADLRYFEDGKILLRPTVVKALPGR